jgi:signal transduction histidine kinase
MRILRQSIFKPTLGLRIALAMIGSLIAVQSQAFFQIWVFSNPEIRMVGTRWLANAVNEEARSVFSMPADARERMLSYRPTEAILHVEWSNAKPTPEGSNRNDPIVARLAATLKSLADPDIKSFDIEVVNLSYTFPNRAMRVVIEPASVADDLGKSPILPDQADILIPANIRLTVQGPDDTWLTVSTIGFRDTGFNLRPPLTPLIAGGIIITLFSILTARWIVAPLDQLVVAANRIGNARDIVSVPHKGLAEFTAVAKAFEEMQQRLRRFVGDRTQMLAAISHDLRSSLTRLRLAAEDFQDDRARLALIAEIAEMNAMLESTLAFAGTEGQIVPSHRIDIAAMLISLVDDAADTGRACTYAGPDHAEIMGHPVSLKRAFFNLIDNAIKYGRQADVTVEVDPQSIRVSIRDTGPGIAADRIAEAFTPFRRLDPSRNGSIPGAGLGLTIARDVVQSHGGDITLKTARSGGLEVVVVLPRAANLS